MNRKIVFLLVFLCWIVSCTTDTNNKTAHETKSPSVALKEFKSDSAGFSMSYPQNWEQRTNASRVGFFEKLQDSSDRFQENMIVWSEEMPIKISDSLYAKASTAELKIKNPKMVVTDLPVKKLGSQTFHIFEFDYLNPDSTIYKVRGYTTVVDKKGFNFSCASSPETYQAHIPQFENMLATFKPLK